LPVERPTKAAAEQPLLFARGQRVGVQYVIQALCPRIAVLVARDGVVACPHDALDAEGVYRASQVWHEVWIRILPVRQKSRRMAPLHRDVGVLRQFTNALKLGDSF